MSSVASDIRNLLPLRNGANFPTCYQQIQPISKQFEGSTSVLSESWTPVTFLRLRKSFVFDKSRSITK